MLSATFNNLPQQRQEKILRVCLETFVAEGFDGASTNQMVSQLGIAKGTIFKYAGSKKNLFLHLFEQVLTELAEIQDTPAVYRSKDLFVRLEDLFEALLAYADEKPLWYRFALRATVDTSSSIFAEVEKMRVSIAKSHLTAFFEGVDWDLYCHPEAEVIELFTWLNAGSRAAAITSLGRDFSMQNYIALMRKQLALLNKLLHEGIYKGKERP